MNVRRFRTWHRYDHWRRRVRLARRIYRDGLPDVEITYTKETSDGTPYDLVTVTIAAHYEGRCYGNIDGQHIESNDGTFTVVQPVSTLPRWTPQ